MLNDQHHTYSRKWVGFKRSSQRQKVVRRCAECLEVLSSAGPTIYAALASGLLICVETLDSDSNYYLCKFLSLVRKSNWCWLIHFRGMQDAAFV